MLKKKNIILVVIFLTFIVSLLLSSTNAVSANHAFSCGGDYGNFSTWDDAIKAANFYETMGYDSYYSTDPSYKTLNGNFSDGWRRLHSDILFFSSHGDSNGVYFPDSSLVISNGDSKSVYTKNVNWDYVRLVVFGACETAKGTNNITTDAYNRKVEASVGWSTTIGNISHSLWLERFNSNINMGASVKEAIDYANGFKYNDPNVKNVVLKGSGSLRLRRVRSLNLVQNNLLTNNYFPNNKLNGLNKLETLKKLDIEGESIKFSENDTSDILDFIRSKNDRFTSNNYEITIHKISENDYTIDIYLKENDYITDYGYTINVSNNKVMEIVDNTYEISGEKNLSGVKKQSTSIETKEEAKRKAIESLEGKLKDEYKDKYQVKNQEIQLYKNLKEDKQYIVVFTQYSINDRGTAVDEYLYDI